jgi:hypothetical protein
MKIKIFRSKRQQDDPISPGRRRVRAAVAAISKILPSFEANVIIVVRNYLSCAAHTTKQTASEIKLSNKS